MKEMNLLPEDYLSQRNKKKNRKYYILISITILILLTFSYIEMYYIKYSLERQISQATDHINSLEKVRDMQLEMDETEEQLESKNLILDNLDDNSINHDYLLEQLKDTFPQEVVLTELQYSPESGFDVSGIASDSAKIADFIINISKIQGVRDVMLNGVDYASTSDKKSFFNVHFIYELKGEGEYETN